MSQPTQQVEVQLGHLCNNRCVFCVSGQLSEQKRAPQLDEAPIRRQLRAARDAGATKITLLGGEPTLQRSFLPLLQFAVDLNFDEIVIFTNGVMTPRDSFRQRVNQILSGLGADVQKRVVWRFSLQGGDRAHHDATTINAGAWDRIAASMTALHDDGARITGNMCVVEQNYRSVATLAEVAERFDFEDLHLDMVRPRDSGDRTDAELRAMMARYSDMAPHFRALLARCDERLGADFDVNIGNLPYCIAPELAHKVHHDGEATVTVAASGQGTTQEGFDKYADKRSDKHKLPGCADCVFDDQCGGIFDKYGEFHGHDEFSPVSAEALWDLDHRGAHFVLLSEATIRRWAGDSAVVGRVDERAGTVDVALSVAGGGRWQLILRNARSAARRGGWAWLTAAPGDDARLGVELVGAYPAGDNNASVSALRAALAALATELGCDAPVVDDAGIAAAWQRARAQHQQAQQQRRQAQRRVAAIADRLRGKELAGLQFGGVSQGDSEGAVALLWSRGEAELRLQIAPGDGSTRPHFGHQATGLSEAALASFNVALGAALRQSRPRS